MNDDWRIEVTCPTTATAANLGEELREGEFQHELRSGAGDRVIVSVDNRQLFLYAGTREQAEHAAEAVRSLAAKSGVSVTTELRRWHPIAEEWVGPDTPLPDSGAGQVVEHEDVIERERRETARMGYAEWEVRVTTGSHRETVELAEKLRDDGLASLRRWRYLIIGAADEDSANKLAERVRAIAPADATVEVEASAAAVEAEMPANPFAVFGGLGV